MNTCARIGKQSLSSWFTKALGERGDSVIVEVRIKRPLGAMELRQMLSGPAGPDSTNAPIITCQGRRHHGASIGETNAPTRSGLRGGVISGGHHRLVSWGPIEGRLIRRRRTC